MDEWYSIFFKEDVSVPALTLSTLPNKATGLLRWFGDSTSLLVPKYAKARGLVDE